MRALLLLAFFVPSLASAATLVLCEGGPDPQVVSVIMRDQPAARCAGNPDCLVDPPGLAAIAGKDRALMVCAGGDVRLADEAELATKGVEIDARHLIRALIRDYCARINESRSATVCRRSIRRAAAR